MLSKASRLPHSIFTGRAVRRARFEFGSVSFYPTNPSPKAAVVISKKVSKSAVVRNTIRRRVLHALKPLIPHLTHSVAIYPTIAAAKAPLSALTQALEQVCVTR